MFDILSPNPIFDKKYADFINLTNTLNKIY